MRLQQDWHRALESARLGDLAPAHEARQAEPASTLADYFFARCLTEAPAVEEGQYARAFEMLKAAVQAQPSNPIFVQTMILSLARSPDPELRRQASALWRRHGLTHDLELLGQTALTIEMQLRPLPEAPRSKKLAWPEGLTHPPEFALQQTDATAESDKMTLPDAPNESPASPVLAEPALPPSAPALAERKGHPAD